MVKKTERKEINEYQMSSYYRIAYKRCMQYPFYSKSIEAKKDAYNQPNQPALLPLFKVLKPVHSFSSSLKRGRGMALGGFLPFFFFGAAGGGSCRAGKSSAAILAAYWSVMPAI